MIEFKEEELNKPKRNFLVIITYIIALINIFLSFILILYLQVTIVSIIYTFFSYLIFISTHIYMDCFSKKFDNSINEDKNILYYIKSHIFHISIIKIPLIILILYSVRWFFIDN